MSDTAIKVTVSDPDTGEVLGEAIIDNDYTLICAGSCYLDGTQASRNGTHVLTVKGAPSPSNGSGSGTR